MNARQAAKKYKRLYEGFMNKPLPHVVIERQRVIRLATARMFSPSAFVSVDYMKELAAEDLSKEIVKHMSVMTTMTDMGIRFDASIGIVADD